MYKYAVMSEDLRETDGSEVVASDLDFSVPGDCHTLDREVVQQVLIGVARRIASAHNDAVGLMYAFVANNIHSSLGPAKPFQSMNEVVMTLEEDIRLSEESARDPAYVTAYRDVVRQSIRILREQSGLPAEVPASRLTGVQEIRAGVTEVLTTKPRLITLNELTQLMKTAASRLADTRVGEAKQPFEHFINHLKINPRMEGSTLCSYAEVHQHTDDSMRAFRGQLANARKGNSERQRDSDALYEAAYEEIVKEALVVLRQEYDMPEHFIENATVTGQQTNNSTITSPEARKILTSAIVTNALTALSTRVLNMEIGMSLPPPATFRTSRQLLDYLAVARQTFAGVATMRGGACLSNLTLAIDDLTKKLCANYALLMNSPPDLPPMQTGPDGRPVAVPLGGGTTMQMVSAPPGGTSTPGINTVAIPKSPILTKELWTKIYTTYATEHFMMKALFHRDYRQDVSKMITAWHKVSKTAKDSLKFPVTHWGIMEQTWGLWEGAYVLHDSVTDPVSRKFLAEEVQRRKRNLERFFYSVSEACTLQGKPHLSLPPEKPEVIRSTMLLPETVLSYSLQGQDREMPPEPLLAWVGRQPIIQNRAEYEAFRDALSSQVTKMDIGQYGLTYVPEVFDEQLQQYFNLPEAAEASMSRVLTKEKFESLLKKYGQNLLIFKADFGPARACTSEIIAQWNSNWDATMAGTNFPLTTWEQVDAYWRVSNADVAIPDNITHPLERAAVREMIARNRNWQHHFYRLLKAECDLDGEPTLYDPTLDPGTVRGTVLFPETALAYYFDGQGQPQNIEDFATWASSWPMITCMNQLEAFLQSLTLSSRNKQAAAECEKKVLDMARTHFDLPPMSQVAFTSRFAEMVIQLSRAKAPPGTRSVWDWFIDRATTLRNEEAANLTPIADLALQLWLSIQMLGEHAIHMARLSFPLYQQDEKMTELLPAVREIWNTVGVASRDPIGSKIGRDLWLDARFRPIVPPAIIHNDGKNWPIITSFVEAWEALLSDIQGSTPLREGTIIAALNRYTLSLERQLAETAPEAQPHLAMWIYDTKEILAQSLPKNCAAEQWLQAAKKIRDFTAAGEKPPAVIMDNDVLRTLFMEWKHHTFTPEERSPGVISNDLLSRLSYHYAHLLKTGTLQSVIKDTLRDAINAAGASLREELISWQATFRAEGELSVTSPPDAAEVTRLLDGLDRALPSAKQACLLLLERHLTPLDRLPKSERLTATLVREGAWLPGKVLVRAACPSLNMIEKLTRQVAQEVSVDQKAQLDVLNKAIRAPFKLVYDHILNEPIDSIEETERFFRYVGGILDHLQKPTPPDASIRQAIARKLEAHFREWITSCPELRGIWKLPAPTEPRDTSTADDPLQSDADVGPSADNAPLTGADSASGLTEAPLDTRPARPETKPSPVFADDIDFAQALIELDTAGQDAPRLIAAALQELATIHDRPNGELADLVRSCLATTPSRSYAVLGSRLWLMLKSQRKRPGFLATARELANIPHASDFLALIELYRPPAQTPAAAEVPTADEPAVESVVEAPAADSPRDELKEEVADTPTEPEPEAIVVPTVPVATPTRPPADRESAPRSEHPTPRMAPPTDPDPEKEPVARPAASLPRGPDAPPLKKRASTELKEKLKKLGFSAENMSFESRVTLATIRTEMAHLDEARETETDPETIEAIDNLKLNTLLALKAILVNLRHS